MNSRTEAVARRPEGRAWLAVVLALLAFTAMWLWTAWLCDDAYITFRTVENFHQGYGLRWNTHERVQTYTHPLWMLLLLVARTFGSLYFAAYALSFGCSLAALWMVFRLSGFSAPAIAVVATLALSSRAFVDFSSSGLENPLSHLLAASLVAAVVEGSLMRTSLAGAFLGLTRPDLLILGLPATIQLARTRGTRGVRLFKSLLPAMALLASWGCFAFVYYGFLLPNTAYAKLFVAGVPRASFVNQGIQFLIRNAETDPATSFVVAAGLLLGLTRARTRALVFGAFGFLAYVVWVGGDFMSGRFLSTPFVLALGIIASVLAQASGRAIGGSLAIALALCLLPQSPFRTAADFGLEPPPWVRGVHDERAVYFRQTSLRLFWGESQVRQHDWWRWGEDLRAAPKKSGTMFAVGFFGVAAGPDRIVIDRLGLGDPLMARIPVVLKPDWIVGHFERDVPDGYEETLDSGVNKIRDPALHSYYDRLAFVTQGPLFSGSRLVEALRMNFGAGQQLVSAYAEHVRSLKTTGRRREDPGSAPDDVPK